MLELVYWCLNILLLVFPDQLLAMKHFEYRLYTWKVLQESDALKKIYEQIKSGSFFSEIPYGDQTCDVSTMTEGYIFSTAQVIIVFVNR